MITQRELVCRWGVAMRRFLLAAVMCRSGAGRAGGRHARSSDPARRVAPTALSTRGSTGRASMSAARAATARPTMNFAGSNASMLARPARQYRHPADAGSRNGSRRWARPSRARSAYGGFAGYNWQWDDVVVGVEASYIHGKFGGTSTRPSELVSGFALSDSYFHDVHVESRHRSRFRISATFRARAGLCMGLLPALCVRRLRARQCRHRALRHVHDRRQRHDTGLSRRWRH